METKERLLIEGRSYNHIVRAGAVVFLLSMIDKVLALGKEMVIALRFGISLELDVFNVAFALPGITILMISGAFTSVYVPLYVDWASNSSRQDADAKSVGFFYLMSAVFGVLAILGCLASPYLFSIAGYGFDPGAKRLGASLEASLMLMLFFDGMGIVLAAILYANKNFVALYSAPLCINISIVVLVLYGSGMGIYALVWGTVIGVFCKTVWMLVVLRRGGFIYFKRWELGRDDIHSLMVLMLPLFVGQLIANSNILIDQVMVAGLSSGSVSSLRYAYRINDLPIQVIVLAMTKTIFPYISEMAVAKDDKGLRDVFSYSLILLAFIAFPIIVTVVLFADDLVKLLLQRGAFDVQATIKTAQILVCYSIGLFFHAYTFINSAFFAALKDTMPLFKLGCVSIVLNVIFNLAFMAIWEEKGIALSTTAGHAIISVIFMILLRRRLGFRDSFRLQIDVLRLLAAGAGMLILGFAVNSIIDAYGIPRIAALAPAVFILCLAYLSMVWLFRSPEIEICFTFVTNFVRWRKAP